MARLRPRVSFWFLARMALAALVVFWIAAMVIFAITESRLRKDYGVAVRVAEPDPALAAEGAVLARSRGCADCHGDDFSGKVVVDEMPFGRFTGDNLRTPGDARTLHERIYRALHHGVDMESRPLMLMPSASYASLSRREVEAIAAYLAALPPVRTHVPDSALGPLGRVLLLTGKLEGFLAAEKIDHAAVPLDAPPAPGTVAYGRHAAQLCKGCHRKDFGGGPIALAPDLPPASNLTPHATGLLHWTEEDFISAMRTGLRPDGTAIDERAMPWRALGHARDVELRAIWRYLRTVPAVDRRPADNGA